MNLCWDGLLGFVVCLEASIGLAMNLYSAVITSHVGSMVKVPKLCIANSSDLAVVCGDDLYFGGDGQSILTDDGYFEK